MFQTLFKTWFILLQPSCSSSSSSYFETNSTFPQSLPNVGTALCVKPAGAYHLFTLSLCFSFQNFSNWF
jgi:hypothetical protein